MKADFDEDGVCKVCGVECYLHDHPCSFYLAQKVFEKTYTKNDMIQAFVAGSNIMQNCTKEDGEVNFQQYERLRKEWEDKKLN